MSKEFPSKLALPQIEVIQKAVEKFTDEENIDLLKSIGEIPTMDVIISAKDFHDLTQGNPKIEPSAQ